MPTKRKRSRRTGPLSRESSKAKAKKTSRKTAARGCLVPSNADPPKLPPWILDKKEKKTGKKTKTQK
jgi:hypothetical protein